MTNHQLDIAPGKVAFHKEPPQLSGTSCDSDGSYFNYTASREFRIPDGWNFTWLPYGWQQPDLRQWMDVIHDRQLAKDQCNVDPDVYLCGMSPNNRGGCASRVCSTRGNYPADPRLYAMECAGSNVRARPPTRSMTGPGPVTPVAPYAFDREDGFAPDAAQLPRYNTVYKLMNV
jgi:hypothetical protein